MQVITGHINADFDCTASMLLLKKIYPEAVLVFSGSQEKNVRSFLEKHDDMIPYKTVSKVDMESVSKLIIADTGLASRIGDFAEVIKKKNIPLSIYDHHPRTDEDLKASDEEVRDETGATVTLLVELFQKQGRRLSAAESTLAMMGIYEDTGCLTFRSTTPRDMEAAAALLRWGADLSIVSDYVKIELTTQQVSLLNDLIESCTEHRFGGLKVVISTASRDDYIADLAVLVHKLVDMEGFHYYFALVRMGSRIFLVGRSRGPELDVGKAAAHFDGGGHQTAASAVIRNKTLVEVEEELLRVIKNIVQPLEFAEDLMTSSIQTLASNATIKQSVDTMNRYSVNALPVEENDKLKGFITRQTADKALSHGLDACIVKDYMTTDVVYVSRKTEIEEVVSKIVENRLKFLPVVEGREVVGLITRMDILRYFHEKGSEEKEEADRGSQKAIKKNVLTIMRERLSSRIWELIIVVQEVADRLGYRVYLAGGIVRDILLREDNEDIDIVVEGDGIRLAKHTAKRLKADWRFHRKFNTASIELPDGIRIDVATARTEFYDKPGAVPTVETGSSIKQDLYRRDFTINAMAICLNKVKFGRLYDYYSGQKDLKEGIIRVLHGLSFIEDPTRAFRAVRFEQRFGFEIGAQTLNFIKTAVSSNVFSAIRGRRISTELKAILKQNSPLDALKRLQELSLLQFINQDLKLTPNLCESFQELEKTLTWFRLQFNEERLETWRINLAMFLKPLSSQQVNQTLAYFEFSKKSISDLLRYYRDAKSIIHSFRNNLERHEIFYALHQCNIHSVVFTMALLENDDQKRIISHYLTNLRKKQVLMSGRDLIEMGFDPGPKFSLILNQLLKEKFKGKLKTKKDEKQWVEEQYGGK